MSAITKEVKARVASSRYARLAKHLYRSGSAILSEEGGRALIFKMRERASRNIDASRVPFFEADCAGDQQKFLDLPLACTVKIKADMLYRIDVLTKTGPSGQPGLCLAVEDEAGNRVREVTVRGRQVGNGGHTAFRFKPIRGSAGKQWTFVLRQAGTADVAVAYDPRPTHRMALLVNGNGIEGSVSLKAYAQLGKRRAYDIWIMKNEPDVEELKALEANARKLVYQPKISIVTPVYNPEVAWIKSAMDSALGQVYPNWELCLADASTRDDVKQVLREYAEKDYRIKVKFLEKNQGISGNTNEAMRLATGEYVGFLDHDDELSPDALYEMVAAMQAERDIDMIYSDEDFVDMDGVRNFPSFKPEWSPDLFLSGMYTCHLTLYRATIVSQTGEMRPQCDGAQDYDFALRFVEKAHKIRHVPKVLYHWRQVPGSTSVTPDNKKYAIAASATTLADYMARNGIKGDVTQGMWPGSLRLKREIVRPYRVSAVVYVIDARNARQCVQSISAPDVIEIILVDGTPGKNLQKIMGHYSLPDNVHIVERQGTMSRSEACDLAARRACGDALIFLAGDITAQDAGWLEPLIEHVQREEVGAVGCRMLCEDGTIQHAGMIVGMACGKIKGVAGYPHRGYPGKQHGYMGRIGFTQNLSAVTGDCLMIRKAVYDRAGGLDPGFKAAFHDLDLCLKLRQMGYLIVYTPYTTLRRHSPDKGCPSPSHDSELREDISIIKERWGSVIQSGDPYFNPNLSTCHGDFRIRL